MKILFPQNIFSALLVLSLPEDLKKNVEIKSSATIAKELEDDPSAIGFLPSCDLIDHKDFFVSNKFFIAFDGLLSNSYLYFSPNQKNLSEFLLRGDVSKNDILLAKILFSERFDTALSFKIDLNESVNDEQNFIVSGRENFDNNLYQNGLSFSDQVAELIDYPYVNFILAAKSEKMIKEFSSKFESLDRRIEDDINNILAKLDLDNATKDFFKMNLNSVYFDMTKNEIDGLKELYKLLFYHGIIEDLFEINFVS